MFKNSNGTDGIGWGFHDEVSEHYYAFIETH